MDRFVVLQRLALVRCVFDADSQEARTGLFGKVEWCGMLTKGTFPNVCLLLISRHSCSRGADANTRLRRSERPLELLGREPKCLL